MVSSNESNRINDGNTSDLYIIGSIGKSFVALGGLKSLIVGVAMCASLAMCLPISTPPNALAHSTGIINTRQMAIVGLIVGVVGIVLGYLMLIFVGF